MDPPRCALVATVLNSMNGTSELGVGLDAYDDPNTHPAMAAHYAKRLRLCADGMSQSEGVSDEAGAFYARMEQITHSEVETAEYALSSAD